MECGKPFEIDQKLKVILPTKPPVKVDGRVAWCKRKGLSYQLGIKFVDLNQGQKRALIEFMSSLFWQRGTRRIH